MKPTDPKMLSDIVDEMNRAFKEQSRARPQMRVEDYVADYTIACPGGEDGVCDTFGYDEPVVLVHMVNDGSRETLALTLDAINKDIIEYHERQNERHRGKKPDALKFAYSMTGQIKDIRPLDEVSYFVEDYQAFCDNNKLDGQFRLDVEDAAYTRAAIASEDLNIAIKKWKAKAGAKAQAKLARSAKAQTKAALKKAEAGAAAAPSANHS